MRVAGEVQYKGHPVTLANRYLIRSTYIVQANETISLKKLGFVSKTKLKINLERLNLDLIFLFNRVYLFFSKVYWIFGLLDNYRKNAKVKCDISILRKKERILPKINFYCI